jgi:hypothetical protein
MSKGTPLPRQHSPRASYGERPRQNPDGGRGWKHQPRWNLTLKQIKNNFAALEHAERLGLRPNITLDINFGVGELLDADYQGGACIRGFLKLARQWIEKEGGQTAYIYALENRLTHIGLSGVHAHVLIHVPDHLRARFHNRKSGWANRVGLTCREGLFGPTKKKQPRPRRMTTLEAVKGKLRYMSKDAEPRALALFIASDGKPLLHDSEKPSNAPIYGMKTGRSRNIGAKARASYCQAS